MTRHDTLQCVHEPFGDAYYFGPERLAERYESDPQARKESGYEESTYRTIFDRIARENSEVRLLMFRFLSSSLRIQINFYRILVSFVAAACRVSLRLPPTNPIIFHPTHRVPTFIRGYIAQYVSLSIRQGSLRRNHC
jgi:hypothetical protein